MHSFSDIYLEINLRLDFFNDWFYWAIGIQTDMYHNAVISFATRE